MSDEMENMQPENQMFEQNEMPEQISPASEPGTAETPVKKRRGRPLKKRTETEAESPVDTASDFQPDSDPAEKTAPAPAAFGAKSAAHDASFRDGAEDPDFGDDGDYDPASVQHVDSFTPSSRDGLKVDRKSVV